MVLAGLLIYAWAGAVRLTRPITDFYAAGAKVPAVYNGMAIAAVNYVQEMPIIQNEVLPRLERLGLRKPLH
jgi:Na+(H+)/acetate symporter ActP